MHMMALQVRAKLLSETSGIERAEQARKQRDIKKFGKKVSSFFIFG